MLYTVFDLETTGLNTMTNDIIQFAYIQLDERLIPIKGGNFYFYQDNMSWTKKAFDVHKLPKEFLRQHKDSFDKNLCNMYAILQRGVLVGHNSSNFDIPFAQQFMIRAGLPTLTHIAEYDTMKIFSKEYGRLLKLTKLVSMLDIKEHVINNWIKRFFEDTSGDEQFHDARFDVVATALCFKEAHRRGIINLTT